MIQTLPTGTFAVDVDDPTLIRVSEIAGRLPSPPHRNTINRWVREGMGGVRLPAVFVGGTAYTTPAAWREWIAATQPRRDR